MSQEKTLGQETRKLSLKNILKMTQWRMFQKRPIVCEISSEDLKAKLDHREPITIIDVREPDEYEICRLPEAKLIPLRQIPKNLSEFKPDEFTVLYCHHGMRSAQAVIWLNQNGFKNVASLRGGIDDWALKVDSSMERY